MRQLNQFIFIVLVSLLVLSYAAASKHRNVQPSISWESINVTEVRNEVLERESDLLSKLDLHFQLPKHKIRTLPSWLPRQCGPNQPEDRPWPSPREFDASVEARLLQDLYTEEEYRKVLVGEAIPRAYIRMVDWLFEHGFQTLERAAFMFHSPLNISVVAIKTIKPKQQLFNVPAAVMIYADSARVAPRTRRALQIWRSLMANPGLPDSLVHKNFENALVVYFERKMPDSFWKPYLDTLQDPTQPAMAGPEVKAALQGQPVWLFCRSAYRAAYLRFIWLLQIPEFKALLAPDFDFDQETSEFLWALLAVDARETVWEEGRTVLVPTFDLFRHGTHEEASFSFEDTIVASPDVTSVIPPILKGKTFVLRVASVSERNIGFSDELHFSYSYNMNTLEMYTDYGIILPKHDNDHILMSIPATHPDYKANLTEALVDEWDMELSTTISSEGTLSLPFVLAFAYAHSGSGKLVKLITAELDRSPKYVKALKDDSNLNADGTLKVDEAEKKGDEPAAANSAGAKMKEFEEPIIDADGDEDEGDEEEEDDEEDEESEEESGAEGEKTKKTKSNEKAEKKPVARSDDEEDKEKSTPQSSAPKGEKTAKNAAASDGPAPIDADDKEKSQKAHSTTADGDAASGKEADQHTGPKSGDSEESDDGEEEDEEDEDDDDEDDDDEDEDDEKKANRRSHSEFKKERDLLVLHYTYVAVADAIAKSLLELSKESSDTQDQAILDRPPADISHAVLRAVAYRKRIKSFMRQLVVKLMNHATRIKTELHAPEFPDRIKGSWPLLSLEHSPSGVKISTQVEDEQNDGEWARQVSTRRLLMERGITGLQWNLAVTRWNALHPESIPPPPHARATQTGSGAPVRDEL